MPRLNARGDVITGGGQTWLDPAHDSRRVGQLLIDGQWRVCIDGKPVADRGCNFIAAGAGFWLGYEPGFGVFGADGLFLPGAALPAGLDGRGAASFDGAIAIADNTDNIGLTLLTENGEVTAHVPGARLTDKLCVVSKTQALWIDQSGEVQTVGLPKPQMLPGQKLWPKVLILNGERWICYHSDDAIGVVLHPFDSFDGYPITLPPAFYLDAVALSEQLVRIVWALDSAEARIDDEDINVVTDQRVRLGNVPTPPPPPKPEPKPEPEKPPMSVPDYSAEAAAFLSPRLRRIEGDEDATRAVSFEALNALVSQLHQRDPNVGLLEKTGGSQVRDRAADIVLIDLGNGTAQVVDVIGDAEGHDGDPRPGWDVKDIRPISQWKPPYPLAGEPQPNPGTPPPNPGTPPPAPSVDLSAVLARLDAIERRIDAGNADTRAAVLALAEAVEVLRTRPVPVPSVVFPDYNNRIIGTMRPVK